MVRPSKVIPAWLRWLLVPWSEVTLAVALVAAAASPALLLAASNVWNASAADQVTAGVTADTTAARAGIDVSIDVVFSDAELIGEAEKVVADRLVEVDGLSGVTSTFSTPVGLAMARQDPTSAESVRLFARPGAIEALKMINQDNRYEDGVLISSWLAERTGATIGSTIDFEAAARSYLQDIDRPPSSGVKNSFTVSGIYEPLWSADGADLPDYWEDVDPGLIPRYLGPFRAPSFELMITNQSTLAGSGGPGVVQWTAAARQVPSGYDDLMRLSGEYRNLETSFVSDVVLSSAIGDLAGLAPRNVRVVSGLTDTLAVVQDAVTQMDQPLALVRAVGIIVGLSAMAAAGIFLVDRRRTEYRLLSSEGERWWRIAGRTAAQLFSPVAAGTLLGVAAGVVMARSIGPADSLRWDSVHVGSLALFSLGALGLASLVVGLAGQHTLDEGVRRNGNTTISLLMVAAAVATAFLWSQVSRTSSTGAAGIDLAVVALPVVGLVASTLLVMTALRRIVSHVLRWSPRLSLGALFALRRTASSERAMRLVSGALGFGIGMVLFSLILVNSLDRTIDVKMATEIGSETRLDLFGPVGDGLDLPDGSTVMMVQDTRLSPGQVRVRVIAIDSDSFAGAVTWPDEFGSSAKNVVSLLSNGTGSTLPVVAIDGAPVAAAGTFGTVRQFPFEVVGRVRSIPLSSEFGTTIMVDSGRLDRFELQRIADAKGLPINDPDVLAQYRRPTDSFRRHVVSVDSRSVLEPLVEAAGMGIRTESTRETRAADVDVVASRSSFDYLGLLGYVVSVMAVAALMLHLSARRRSTALASVMLRRMGLGRVRATLFTALEMATITLMAALSALLAAFLLARHVVGRFDPAPRLPPEIEIGFPYLWGTAAVAGATALVGAIAFLAELSSLRQSDSRVVRDGP